jgi:hypothetical protein
LSRRLTLCHGGSVLIEPGDFAIAIVGQQRRLSDRRAPGSKRIGAAHDEHEEYAVGVSFRGKRDMTRTSRHFRVWP